MERSESKHIWTQPKSNVYFNMILISILTVASLILCLIFPQTITQYERSALFVSSALSIVFLSMYVMGGIFQNGSIVFILPYKKVEMNNTEIDSARLIRKRSNDYLDIRTTRRVGIHKQIYFLVEKNESDITEVLNGLLKGGVKVYTKSSLETKIKFNSVTKTFECI